MGDQTKGIWAQIVVGVVTGIVIGVLSGSGTAYMMVAGVDRKVDVHISENSSTESQIRRDIVRLEQNDLALQTRISNMAGDLNAIRTSTAVIEERLRRWEPAE